MVIKCIILFIILILLFIFIKYFYVNTIMHFYDANTILISKTIRVLINIYNYKSFKNNYNYYNDEDKKIIDLCIKNKLIIKRFNTLLLTPTSLQICFNYTNNKFIYLNIAFSLFAIIIASISLYLQLYIK